LVEKNFKKYRQLNFYADKLCITAKYLSTTVKNNSGISASEWIKRYVILEAQRLLKNSSMTIQQISNELNFPSQTFFSKYFKHQIGLSPKEYRKS
jgi:transcriptional regulator, araC family